MFEYIYSDSNMSRNPVKPLVTQMNTLTRWYVLQSIGSKQNFSNALYWFCLFNLFPAGFVGLCVFEWESPPPVLFLPGCYAVFFGPTCLWIPLPYGVSRLSVCARFTSCIRSWFAAHVNL